MTQKIRKVTGVTDGIGSETYKTNADKVHMEFKHHEIASCKQGEQHPFSTFNVISMQMILTQYVDAMKSIVIITVGLVPAKSGLKVQR